MNNHNHKVYWAFFSHVPNINTKRWQQLLSFFPNIEDAWKGNKTDYINAGIDNNFVENLLKFKKANKPDSIIEKLDRYNVRIITIYDEEYPINLKEIYTPPYVIFVKGELIKKDEYALAVVGSRKCTDYGKRATKDIVAGVASSGITIVSGLALGLDAEAHWAALKAGGRTIAVLANGLDTVYPTTNKSLAERIIENGCIISEQPIGMPPLKQNFPARNRIISGLSKGVLISEAGERSGTLHTSSFAIEQNRNIYAIPGPIYNPLAKGPNNLIKHGAKPTTCSLDILEDFGIEETAKEKQLPENSDEKIIFEILESEPKHIDDISKETKKESHEISRIISIMEIKGKVKHLGGMVYTLN